MFILFIFNAFFVWLSLYLYTENLFSIWLTFSLSTYIWLSLFYDFMLFLIMGKFYKYYFIFIAPPNAKAIRAKVKSKPPQDSLRKGQHLIKRTTNGRPYNTSPSATPPPLLQGEANSELWTLLQLLKHSRPARKDKPCSHYSLFLRIRYDKNSYQLFLSAHCILH